MRFPLNVRHVIQHQNKLAKKDEHKKNKHACMCKNMGAICMCVDIDRDRCRYSTTIRHHPIVWYKKLTTHNTTKSIPYYTNIL